MKSSTVFCALIAIVIGAQIVSSHINAAPNAASVETPTSEDYLEDNKAWPGMFFSTESVVEEYEYDDAYCLLYDDADANMFNVEICVDLETYQMVQNATKSGKHIVGTLVLNDDYSYDDVQVFTYMSDPEFEMAEASANSVVISTDCLTSKF